MYLFAHSPPRIDLWRSFLAFSLAAVHEVLEERLREMGGRR